MTDLLATDAARRTTDTDPTGRHEEGGEASHERDRDRTALRRVVVDTSVLIADPHCIATFEDTALVIPLIVVEELDSLKTRPDDVGRSARTALRAIEDLRIQHGGSLADPVPVGTSTVQIEINGIQEGFRSTRQTPLVPPFLRSIRAEGGDPRFTLKLGTSDMTIVGPAWGCPMVTYGPGDASLDHTPEERIDLADYGRAIRILSRVLVAL